MDDFRAGRLSEHERSGSDLRPAAPAGNDDDLVPQSDA